MESIETLLKDFGGRFLRLGRARAESSRPWNAETRREFDELDEAAAEEGDAPCAAATKKTAEKMITEMSNCLPVYYTVSPLSDGSITIETDIKDSRVAVFCAPDGGGSCMIVRKNGGSTIHKSPDIFGEFAEYVCGRLKALSERGA